jgi:hypothetical protein
MSNEGVGNTTENTPLDGTAPGDAPGAAEGSVNWDAAGEFFAPKGSESSEPADEAAGDESGEQEVVYVDEDGNELSPEEIAAAEAEGRVEDETGDTKPEKVDFRINGRTLSLPREDAEALEAARREQRERDGRLGGELQTTRERLAALEAVIADRGAVDSTGQPEAPKRPDAKLALDDIEEWQRQYDAFTDHRIAVARQELVEAYNEEQAQTRQAQITEQGNRAWVQGFYQDNEHLDKPALRAVVSQVYTENREELGQFGDDVAGQYNRLSELTETRIAELTSTSRTLRKPPAVEGATRTTRTVRTAPLRDKPFSSADWSAREREKMKGD